MAKRERPVPKTRSTLPSKENRVQDIAKAEKRGRGITSLPKCDFVSTKTGKGCRNTKGARTPHPGIGRCWRHGGTSPNHIKHGQKEVAKMAVVTYGLPRQIDPQRALLEELWRTAGHVQWLEMKIQELEESAIVWGTTKRSLGGARVEGGNSDGELWEPESEAVEVTREVKQEERSAINTWLVLYQSERKHLVDVSRIAIAAGLAEREVKLAEQQGALIARVINNSLRALGVQGDDERTRQVVRQQLMLVAGGKKDDDDNGGGEE